MVRPLLLKLASTGTVLVITNSASPLLSVKLAEVIALLSKVSREEPGATTGS